MELFLTNRYCIVLNKLRFLSYITTVHHENYHVCHFRIVYPVLSILELSTDVPNFHLDVYLVTINILLYSLFLHLLRSVRLLVLSFLVYPLACLQMLFFPRSPIREDKALIFLRIISDKVRIKMIPY